MSRWIILATLISTPVFCAVIDFDDDNNIEENNDIIALYGSKNLTLENRDCWGSCPMKAVKIDYDSKRFLGTWFLYSRYGTLSLPFGFTKCVTSDYYLMGENRIRVFYTGKFSRYNFEFVFKGEGKSLNPSKTEGKLEFNITVPMFGNILVPYWILETDYNNWALVWTCYNFKILHFESAFVLTRKQVLGGNDNWTKIAFTNAIRKADLNPILFQQIQQTGCQ